MNGPIAQLVALALHGNAFLSGTSLPSPVLGENATTKFCELVQFVRLEKSWFGLGKFEEVQVAASPDAWFAYLKQKHAEQLSVRWEKGANPEVPDRMLAGFVGGGGTWTLVIRFSNGQYERWLARWDIGDRNRKDQRIWRVTYGCVLENKQPPSTAAPLIDARAQLKQALTEIHAFSAKHKCEGFTQCFERALKALAQERDTEAYLRDLYPGSEHTPASDLIYACQQAWVFGGMGSWNDMGFDGADGQEYDRVSEQLYRAIITAIPAAIDDHAVNTRK